MVFDHQMYMTNLITRVGWEVRAALYDAAHGPHVETNQIVRESAVEFVDYLLFIDEARLSRPIQSAAEKGQLDLAGEMPDVRSLRIPVKYLANMLTAGREEPVALALERFPIEIVVA